MAMTEYETNFFEQHKNDPKVYIKELSTGGVLKMNPKLAETHLRKIDANGKPKFMKLSGPPPELNLSNILKGGTDESHE